MIIILFLLIAFIPITYAENLGYISFYFEVRTETDYLGWTEPYLQNFQVAGAIGIPPYKDEITIDSSGFLRAQYKIVIKIDGKTVFSNEYWQKSGMTATFKIYRGNYEPGTHSYRLELWHNHGVPQAPSWHLDTAKEGYVTIELIPPPWQIESYMWIIAMIGLGFIISYALASSTGERGTATIISLLVVSVIYMAYVSSLTPIPNWWWPPSWVEALQKYTSYFVDNLVWLVVAMIACIIGAQVAPIAARRRRPTIVVIPREQEKS
mgnify:CR=1 FL=1